MNENVSCSRHWCVLCVRWKVVTYCPQDPVLSDCARSSGWWMELSKSTWTGNKKCQPLRWFEQRLRESESHVITNYTIGACWWNGSYLKLWSRMLTKYFEKASLFIIWRRKNWSRIMKTWHYNMGELLSYDTYLQPFFVFSSSADL